MTSKPFIKWAGGKYTLANTLKAYLPSDFSNRDYFEPMIGGGGMFFNLQPHNAYLSDINPKLILTYKSIKADVESIISHLEIHEENHHSNEDYYYDQRLEFNLQRIYTKEEVAAEEALLQGAPVGESVLDNKELVAAEEALLQGAPVGESVLDNKELAALFIYLNKTCFNGLYRENSKGEFNVPKGRTSSGKVTICDKDNLRNCSNIFQNVEFGCHSYKDILSKLSSHSFIYLDPPYLPVNSASFTKYAKDDFTEQMHYDLKGFCDKLTDIGAKFMMSNSGTPKTKEIYNGYNMNQVLVSRSVGSKSSARKKVSELIITNY
jgi:DNA adenine methylase